MRRRGAPRRYARQCRFQWLPIAEPLLVGQVFAGFDAVLVDHFQLVVAQPTHRSNLLAPAVGDFIVNGLLRVDGKVQIARQRHAFAGQVFAGQLLSKNTTDWLGSMWVSCRSVLRSVVTACWTT